MNVIFQHIFRFIDQFLFCIICFQAQKELLDAELDFHKKMSSGEDTTDLKRKLGQLQVEVKHTNAIIMH